MSGKEEMEREMQQMWDMAHNRYPLPAYMNRQDAIDRWYELKEQLKGHGDDHAV